MNRTYVLVPGAGGDARYWRRVAPLLRGAGHRAVAVDLPNDPGATLSDQAEAIVAAAAGAEDVVLVAQSMGGFSAPLAVGRLPTSELVLVNAMIPLPGETAGAWWEATGQEEARRTLDLAAGRGADTPFDEQVHFLHDVPAEVLAEIDDGGAGPAGSLFTDPLPLDRWPTVPTRVLSGRDDRFFPYAFQQRLARERLGLNAEPLPGGHLLALSQPDALVERLLHSPQGPDGH
jgi:pimeloyl-ACP methyl ester carboxylesterase